jgi:uncharacterized protein (TIGR00297 family)
LWYFHFERITGIHGSGRVRPRPQWGAGMNWGPTHHDRLLMAALVTLGFAALARLIRGVSTSGAVAGALVSFILYVSLGAGAFAALVSVFVLAWITTRLGYSRKEKRGTAEKSDGRTASQVVANLGVSAVSALLYWNAGDAIFIAAMAAALGEAAADTVSSEYGQARSETALLITNWQEVPAGTNGGVSGAGSIAGMVAAAIISGVCVMVGLLRWRWFWVPAIAAIFGMVVDSFLGASLERKKILNNDQVNFLSTVASATMAALIFKLFR